MGKGGPLGVHELAVHRRSFIRDLALGLSAAILTPHAIDSFKWKQPVGGRLYTLNGAFFTAHYELFFDPAHYSGIWTFTEDSITVVHPGKKKIVHFDRKTLHKSKFSGKTGQMKF